MKTVVFDINNDQEQHETPLSSNNDFKGELVIQ